VALVLLALGLAACERATEATASAVQEHAEKHLDPAYVCPMHRKVTSDRPGRCPI
jgi:Cu(I)/Ag(I) efflux system membrane fusion protein